MKKFEIGKKCYIFVALSNFFSITVSMITFASCLGLRFGPIDLDRQNVHRRFQRGDRGSGPPPEK